MLLKAGTYRFNDVLPELIFEQSIDITTTAEDNGTIATVKISKLAGMQGDNFALVGLFYSIVIEGEEQLNEETPMAVYGGAQKDYWHLPLQTHTITKDVEVEDDFGTWYKENTNYNEINAPKMTLKAGTYRFNDVLTRLDFEQNINFTSTINIDGATVVIYWYAISPDNMDTTFVITFKSNKASIEGEEEEIVQEIESAYDSIALWQRPVDIPPPQIHTITKDTEVDDTFGIWYKANTDYDTVNGEEGAKQFVDLIVAQGDIVASFADLQPGVTISYYYAETIPTENILESTDTIANIYYIADENVAAMYGGGAWSKIGITGVVTDKSQITPTDEECFYAVIIGGGGETPEEPEQPEEPEPIIITFSIEHNATHYNFIAEEGMTFREWVASNYNNNGYVTITIVSGNPDYMVFVSEPEVRLNAGVDDVIIDGQLYYSIAPEEPEPEPEPETPKKKFTRLYLGEVAYSSNGKRFRKLQTEEYVEPSEPEEPEEPEETLEAGLYDENDNFLASWETLVNDYGLDVTIDYTTDNYKTATTSPYYILTNNFTNTKKVVIGDVAKIGKYAFYYCSSLTSVEIPNSVESIGYGAFLGCNSLENVYITDIAAWCNIDFNKVYGNPLDCVVNLYLNGELVTELVIPDSVTSISNYAFNHCSSLTSVTIGDSVTKLGLGAFSECTSLTSVTIPDSVTVIHRAVFSNCTLLNDITFEGTVSQWNSISFPVTSLYVLWNHNVPATYVQCTDGQVAL